MLEFFYNGPLEPRKVVTYLDLSRRFKLRIPKKVSEMIVEDLDKSLNTIFPKMFFDVKVGKGLLEFTVPENETNIDSIVKISEKLTCDTEHSRLFKIELPAVRKKYTISYNVKSRFIWWTD